MTTTAILGWGLFYAVGALNGYAIAMIICARGTK